MGIINHECVIATTWNKDVVTQIKSWVESLADYQRDRFAFIGPVINSYQTIILAPDGSKKGWTEADEGESLRNDFVEKLQSFNYEDGGSPLEWVEVGYGEYGQKVLRGNCKNCYSDSGYHEDNDGGLR